jgi:hypothetical protein
VCGLLVAMASWSSAQSLDEKAELESVSQKPSQGAALDSKPGDKPPKVDPEKWNVKLGGHVQMDYVLWANAPESIPNANNYFNFRRLRLVADGTGYDVCDFRLQMTLEPEPFGEYQPKRILHRRSKMPISR